MTIRYWMLNPKFNQGSPFSNEAYIHRNPGNKDTSIYKIEKTLSAIEKFKIRVKNFKNAKKQLKGCNFQI